MRKAMRVNGMTAGYLAERLGVARASVNNWLNGHHRLRLRDIQAVAEITGVPATRLLHGKTSATIGDEE